MGTGEANIFLSALWLIPLLVIAVLAGIYLLVRHWSQRSQEDLRKLGAEVRRMEERYRGVLQTAGAHSVDDPEPYGSRAASLQEQLDGLEGSIQDLQRRRVTLQEESNRLTFNRWRVLFSAPYYWYQLRKDISEGWDTLGEIGERLESIRDYEKNLEHISWDVAQQARETRAIGVQVKQKYDGLHARGVHGRTMEEALREQMETQATLARIPAYFFSGDQAQVLEQADKERTAEVHALLDEARPDLERLLAQAGAWEQSYSETNEQVARMRQAIDAAAETLKDVPAGVQAEPSRERFAGIQTIAGTLEQTLGRLEAENMGMVAEEAQRVTENVSQMEADIKRAGEQYAILETVLNELTVSLKALAVQVASLRTRTNHPVVWKNSVDILTGLNRELNAIGPAEKPREPEEMRRDLTRAARLNTRHRELAAHCQQIEEAHTELLSLLEGGELGRVEEWLESTRTLVKQVGRYAPANWPSADAVADLPGDVEEFALNVGRLLPPTRQAPIPETELLELREDARWLAAELKSLDKRAVNVHQRLNDLQETERLALDNIHNARVAFNQILFIIHSNAMLSERAATEAERMDAEAQALQDALEGPERGMVEKVVKDVNALLSNMEGSANRWVDQLNDDLRKEVETLSASLTALDGVAGLDEPAVADARRLMSASSQFNLGVRGTTKSRLRLEQLAPELKRRSDYWQSCAAASSALAEVHEYVMASYEEAGHYRRETKDYFAETATWLRQTKDWPPTSISLDDEKGEIKRLDEQWKGLKDRRLKALALVQQLGNYSAKYQTLAGKISQKAERADQEQAQVEELEVELSELAGMWEENRYEYRDMPEADGEIRALLGDIDHELATIRRQYKQKTKNYKQVLRAMKDLNKKVKYWQVALDENNALDASGRVHPRR
jgi:DNA repair exonuclease SbcCD ATPase subunit